MIAKVPRRKALCSGQRAISTRVYGHARVRNAVYVYHGYHLKNSSPGAGVATQSSPKPSGGSPLAATTEHSDPVTPRRRALTTSTSSWTPTAPPPPTVDHSVYQATEAARVSKWLSRFSAEDGVSGIDLSPKPGLQVHMRPPVFDKKVFEATEAVKGEKEAEKVVSEKRNESLKVKREDIRAPKNAEKKKTWEEVLREPVYDTTYPLNASTATGHEANRSGVEPATMEETGSMNAASEPVIDAPASAHPTGYPAQTKMVRDQEVLEATEDLEGSRKIRVYSGSGDKHKIKLDKLKASKPATVVGSRDSVVFAATEKACDSKKLSKFTPPMKPRVAADQARPAASAAEPLQGDVVFRATEELARQHPLPKTSPRAGSDPVVFESTESAAASETVEKYTPGEQTQHLQPKPADFDMLPASKLRRPLPRQFFGTSFTSPARDGTVLMATEALGGGRSTSTSVPRQILEDSSIAIDREVLEATERLSQKPRGQPVKLPEVKSVPPEDELVASLDEPVTSSGFGVHTAATQQSAKIAQDVRKSDYTSWNPPAPPSSSLSDPSHLPFRPHAAAAKGKDMYYGGFDSAYDRNSLSDPFLYNTRSKDVKSAESAVTKPPLVVPDQILHEARARLVEAYNSAAERGLKPNVDELLAAVAGVSASSAATAAPVMAEFAVKTPKGEMRILRPGQEIDGFKLVEASTEAVEELQREAKHDTKRARRKSMFWGAVWVGGLSAGLAMLAEEGRKAGAGLR